MSSKWPDGLRNQDSGGSPLLVIACADDEWIRALAVRCISEELIDDLGHLRGLADADQSGLVRSAIARWEVIGVQDTETLDTVDRVVALQRVPIFAGIDPEDLERIATLLTERRYDTGELIFAWGAEGDDMIDGAPSGLARFHAVGP